MTLPLIPIVLGSAGVAAGSALHAWLNQSVDSWSDKSVFNARMRDMHSLALALNSGFSTCAAFRANTSQLTSWRGNRDNFGKFFSDVGTLSYTSPSSSQISQAKDFASKFYFWTGEYNRLKCGAPIGPVRPAPAPAPAPTSGNAAPLPVQTDPYAPSDPVLTPATTGQDWGEIIKWAAIGAGSLIALKTISDVFKKGV